MQKLFGLTTFSDSTACIYYAAWHVLRIYERRRKNKCVSVCFGNCDIAQHSQKTFFYYFTSRVFIFNFPNQVSRLFLLGATSSKMAQYRQIFAVICVRFEVNLILSILLLMYLLIYIFSLTT